jgi:hypothetical protein
MRVKWLRGAERNLDDEVACFAQGSPQSAAAFRRMTPSNATDPTNSIETLIAR